MSPSAWARDTEVSRRELLLRVEGAQRAMKAASYLEAGSPSTALAPSLPPTSSVSMSSQLTALATQLGDALLEYEVEEPILPDPRPVDFDLLDELRGTGRVEGPDLSAWYASIVDQD